MKVNTICLGLLAALAAIGLGIAGLQLPNPSRQIYGPSFFPVVLAVLLGITAVTLVVEGARESRSPFLKLQPWTRDRLSLIRFAAIPAGVAFYIQCVGFLGFLPTVTILLLGLFLLLGVRWSVALPAAAGSALAVHCLFYLLLRVQLPWGLLESIRW